MFAKIFALSAVVAAAHAGIIGGYVEEQVIAVPQKIDYYSRPNYEFKYGVSDPHTGDNKEQKEVRDGDVVKGYYKVAEPDGTLRTVHYTSDKYSGFNAIVERTGEAIHPAVYGKEDIQLITKL